MFRRLVDALFPRRCAVCDMVIAPDELICPDCRGKIRPMEGDTCYKCGKPLKNTVSIYCYDCSRKIHSFDRGFSVFEYSDIRESLYRFKYQGRAEYARFYAHEAYTKLGSVIEELDVDALIPVPIHKSRLNKRGYNQAHEFAKEFSKLTKIPLCTDLVIRKKATVPLKELDEEGRRNNLKKAFIIRPNGVKLDTIVIIDDIYTTGTTIDTISSLLKGFGVKKIYCLTVAIGRGL